MNLKIIYEDNHLIAVYKPAGILTQADKSNKLCLLDLVKNYLKEKYKKRGNVFLGLLHRLDRNVAGIILFAKTSKGAARLSEQFRKHSVEKIYHAIIIGSPKKTKDTLTHYLKKDTAKNKTKVYDHEIKGALLAELAYEIIKTNNNYSLLKIKLKTGKSHQIRAQLSHIGCPIIGDIKYGAPDLLPDRTIALAATSLTFNLATQKQRKIISINLPREWQNFRLFNF